MSGEEKKEKEALLLQFENLDKHSALRDLSPEEWSCRYLIEEELEQIYQREELYWQQRGDLSWLLKGDSNTSFFHQFANGRRRKNIIRSLEGASGEISNQVGLEEHIIDFYKELVGDRAHVEGSASLQPSGQTENDFLLRIVIILSNLSRRRK